MGADVQYRVCLNTHQAAGEIEGELFRRDRRECGLHDSVQHHSIERLVNRQPEPDFTFAIRLRCW